MTLVRSLFHIAFVVFTVSCLDESSTTITSDRNQNSDFDWQLPLTTPLPVVPENNPMTEEKFQLGRHLFYDERLSGNGSQSCAGCHRQERAFAEDRALSIGSTGEVHPRNSQPLINVGYNATLTWANPVLTTLERQILIPLFGEDPIEHGINDANRDAIFSQLAADSQYQELIQAAYPDAGDQLTTEIVVHSLATFVRALVSFNSPFDQYSRGDLSAVGEDVLRGRDLFFSERLECFHCHGGYNFTNSTVDETTAFIEKPFHNTGLFNIDGEGSFPANNQGKFEVTGNPDDMGKFRAVTLRNIALTSPYMHDGSIETLSGVIDFYSAGGRVIESGPLAGDGRTNPLKDGFVTGFEITTQEKADLLAFLESLTDRDFITKRRFGNPWQEQ